jgi:hypothetical protein
MFGYVKIGIEPSKIGISSTRIGVWPKIGMERPIWRLNLQAEDLRISPNTRKIWYFSVRNRFVEHVAYLTSGCNQPK